jgi:hypothetical protein
MEMTSENLFILITICLILAGYFIFLIVTDEDNDNNGYGV